MRYSGVVRLPTTDRVQILAARSVTRTSSSRATRDPCRHVVLLVAVVLAAVGCASASTDKAQGTSGSVTWEVSDIGRILSADNQRVRWSYVITLRNTGDRPARFERLERAITMSGLDSIGGTPTSRTYSQTLAAGAELRYAAVDTWGWLSGSGGNSTFGGAATLRSVTAYRRFIGTDDRSAPIQVLVTVRLDPTIGRLSRPPTPPANLPPATTLRYSGDLTRVTGSWRGSYRYEESLLDIPIQATILADGSTTVAENDPVTHRFNRRILVKDGGLEFLGGQDRGSFTFHEVQDRRLLVGRV